VLDGSQLSAHSPSSVPLQRCEQRLPLVFSSRELLLRYLLRLGVSRLENLCCGNIVHRLYSYRVTAVWDHALIRVKRFRLASRLIQLQRHRVQEELARAFAEFADLEGVICFDTLAPKPSRGLLLSQRLNELEDRSSVRSGGDSFLRVPSSHR